MVAHPAPELNLETVRTPEEITVRCTGRINASTSALLHTTIHSLLPETKSVVVDLTNVSHMDSSGLGAIFGLYVSAKKQHCALKLINPSQHLQDLFHIVKLDSVFEVHEDFLGYTPE